MAAALSAVCLCAGTARAAPFSFDPVVGIVVDDAGIDIPLTGTAPAGTYTSFTVVMDWTAGGGDPYSEEAATFLVNSAGTRYTAVPLTSTGAGNGSPVVGLTLSGVFITPYAGGAAPILYGIQTYSGSDATWTNVVVTVDDAAISATYGSGATTLASPIFNRTLTGSPPTGLSGTGTAVPYEVIPFHVDTTGDYNILINGEDFWDTFGIIYEGAFDPLNPLVGALTAGDDYIGEIGTTGLFPTLTAGQQYFLVVTGFGNADFGEFDFVIHNEIGGVATLGLVPEPSTFALGGLAAVGMGFWYRRRRAAA